MQYNRATIIINGKIVADTTTTTNDNDTQENDEQNESINFFTFAVNDNNNNNTTKNDNQNDFLYKLWGDNYYGMFGDVHPINYKSPASRLMMWFLTIYYGGVYVMLWTVVIGVCSFIFFLIVVFFLALIF